MAFYIVQFLTGLASAASLFLVASGLSIIFGVTRIVNFAHGAFYMLGAYVAFTLTERFSGALGFWTSILLAALIVAAIGVVIEMVLLRRIYHSPELFQLLATFGLTLMVEDLVVLGWGPSDLVGSRERLKHIHHDESKQNRVHHRHNGVGQAYRFGILVPGVDVDEAVEDV